MCFTAWVDDTSYTISLEALATGALSSKYQLDCVIDPGKSVTGIVGYEVPKDWKEAKIEFTKEAIFGEKTVLLSANKEEIRMERESSQYHRLSPWAYVGYGILFSIPLAGEFSPSSFR